VTFQIATLGSLLAALMALPLAMLTARNLRAPRPLAWAAKGVLDVRVRCTRWCSAWSWWASWASGPRPGVLAIALHSMGTYGKLFAESIESLDMAAVDAVRATGAGEAQVFFHGVWPSVLPQFVSHHLYVWEFNIRDSTILGLIGAGGLGLLISEAVSLFQWSRLATLLIVVVALVMAFDACRAASGRRCCDACREDSDGTCRWWSATACCWTCRGWPSKPGERVAIVGPNGAGKSTLLR
jgi:phosphonate transport system permease protein